ncbi:MAG: Rieske (2Fe-2S) protein, partial [Halieaceae bacterium]|nr:Rieske (2Fe-2S) protein [Halieaceae bacterium]
MATSVDYNLGPNTYPRGWFIVAESKELDSGPMALRYFGQDFALYRGESGKPV